MKDGLTNKWLKTLKVSKKDAHGILFKCLLLGYLLKAVSNITVQETPV